MKQHDISELVDFEQLANGQLRVVPKRSAVDGFHSHLDGCAQCRTGPFALCSVGGRLLERAALRAGAEE